MSLLASCPLEFDEDEFEFEFELDDDNELLLLEFNEPFMTVLDDIDCFI